MVDEKTIGKLLLLGFNVPIIASAAMTAIRLNQWWGYLMLGVTALAVLGACAAFFPDYTTVPIAEAATNRRARREAFRSGRLSGWDVQWLLRRRRNRRYAFVVDGVHDVRAEYVLTRLVVERAAEDPRYGHVVPMWMRLGHDRELLTNALAARIDPRVLFHHLDNTDPLDATTVATLAALVGDQSLASFAPPCGCTLSH